jgi:hypothetical protein
MGDKDYFTTLAPLYLKSWSLHSSDEKLLEGVVEVALQKPTEQLLVEHLVALL